MLIGRVPGLIRLAPRGEIVPSSYDLGRKALGFLQFDPGYIYSMAYDPQDCPWTERDVWRELTADPKALGAMIVNSYILLAVLPEGFRVRTPDQDTAVYATSVRRAFQPMQHVGFVRTAPPYKDLNIPPYQLWVDASGYTYLHGRCVQLPNALPVKDNALYRTLIDSSADAVYNTAAGGRAFTLQTEGGGLG